MFYFSLIFFTMVYSVEQNTFTVVSYFRNGRFVNGEWTYSLSDCKNEFRAKYSDNIQDDSLLTHIGRIVNRFLTTGTVSKGKSSGRPPVSDEIVEDLRERVEETPQISVARLSQQSGVPRSTCHKIIKKIGYNCILIRSALYKNSNLQIIKVELNIVIGFKITSIMTIC
jgi:hypothetical protein